MKMPGFTLTIVIVTSMFVLFSCAEMKQAGRDIGHGTRDLTRTIGHGTRDITREIGHGTRDLTREIGHGTRDVVKSVGEDVNSATGPRSK